MRSTYWDGQHLPTSDEIAVYVDQESTTYGDRENEIGIAGHGVTHLLPRSDKISSLHARVTLLLPIGETTKLSFARKEQEMCHSSRSTR